MSDRVCGICNEPVPPNIGFEVVGVLYCPKCFVQKASQRRTLDKADRNALRREVKLEMESVLPRQQLQEIIEDG